MVSPLTAKGTIEITTDEEDILQITLHSVMNFLELRENGAAYSLTFHCFAFPSCFIASSLQESFRSTIS
jgi:hypothetical protein